MKKLVIVLTTFLVTQITFAKLEIKDTFLKIKKDGDFVLNIISDAAWGEKPNLIVKDNVVQVELNNSMVWPKISKFLNYKKKRIQLAAYQYDKKKVRVRIIFPNGEKLKISNIKSTIENKSLSFSGNFLQNKIRGKKNYASYDESYLKKLIQEKESISKKVKSDTKNILKKDQVKLSYSSPAKIKSKSNFNIWKYAGKFIGFLLMMVVGIYGVFYYLKKGALKRSKIGFLNTDGQIEIVGKHYMSPKRNLCLVRVHQQVFLVANHENGVEFLSEIKEPGKVLQSAEMKVSGNNFTSNLKNNDGEKNFSLKKDINFSHPEKEDEDSLTQKLKNKIKSTRDIQ